MLSKMEHPPLEGGSRRVERGAARALSTTPTPLSPTIPRPREESKAKAKDCSCCRRLAFGGGALEYALGASKHE